MKRKGESEYIVTTPSEAIGLISNLYGHVDERDIYKYEELHSYLKRSASPSDYNEVIETYKRILTISNAIIPDNLSSHHEDT